MPDRSPVPVMMNSASSSRSATICWAWVTASPSSRRPHSASRSRDLRSACARGVHLALGERAVPGVGQHVLHQPPVVAGQPPEISR